MNISSLFKNPVIWIEPLNSVGSLWLSTADCVWDGPQWLKSKRCLKLEGYLELEPLFKVSLKIPDASQVDVINDLLLLKSHSGDKNAVNSQPEADTRRNIGTAGTPYQITLVFDLTEKFQEFQSINAMEEYKKYSFEVSEYCRLLVKCY